MDSDDEIFESFVNSDDESITSSSSDDQSMGSVSSVLSSMVTKDSRVTIPKYVEEVVPKYSDQEFIMHFRINKVLYTNLCTKLKESKHFMGYQFTSSPEKIMAMFLWFIGHQTASYRDVANQFDVSLSTLHESITKVSKFLCDLAPDCIKWPTPEEQNESATFFTAKNGFPNVVGCIDGCHIHIDKPTTQCAESYINRKGYYSVHLQAICDHRKKMIDIFLGYPGSVHDARVFASSEAIKLASDLAENSKYILGDSAYPCTDFLLIPYRDNGFLTGKQKKFNQKLSSCRVFIEHTFGMLKQRFRQLYHLKTRKMSLLLLQIKACCVLHNLASDDDFLFLGEECPPDEPQESTETSDLNSDDSNYVLLNDSKERGKMLRDLLSDSF